MVVVEETDDGVVIKQNENTAVLTVFIDNGEREKLKELL